MSVGTLKAVETATAKNGNTYKKLVFDVAGRGEKKYTWFNEVEGEVGDSFKLDVIKKGQYWNLAGMTPASDEDVATAAANGGGDGSDTARQTSIVRQSTLKMGIEVAIATAKKGSDAIPMLMAAADYSKLLIQYVNTGELTPPDTDDGE